MVFCDYAHIKNNEKFEPIRTQKRITFSSKEAIKDLLEEKELHNMAWGVLYDSKIWDKIRFPIGKGYEDIDTMHYLVEKAGKVVALKNQMYVYVKRKQSIVNSYRREFVEDEIKQVNRRYERVRKKYPEFYDLNDMNRIKFILRYHQKICQGTDKAFWKSKKMIGEYQFFRENYKKIRGILTEYNIQYDILFMSRKIFYYLEKIRYKVFHIE